MWCTFQWCTESTAFLWWLKQFLQRQQHFSARTVPQCCLACQFRSILILLLLPPLLPLVPWHQWPNNPDIVTRPRSALTTAIKTDRQSERWCALVHFTVKNSERFHCTCHFPLCPPFTKFSLFFTSRLSTGTRPRQNNSWQNTFSFSVYLSLIAYCMSQRDKAPQWSNRAINGRQTLPMAISLAHCQWSLSCHLTHR